MKTFQLKKEDVTRNWYVVDATDLIVGRLAGKIAEILRGKHRANFTPHVDSGDFVIVTNCEKLKMTGRKMDSKNYYSYSGYIGGLKETEFKRMMDTHPERVIMAAVKGMLPKNKLRDQMMTRLKVYAGGEHPHTAQKPQEIEL